MTLDDISSWLSGHWSAELTYVLIVFCIFIIPKYLQRFRFPGPVSSFLIGIGAAAAFPELHGDSTIHLLAIFGIVALFLHAGLDIDVAELRQSAMQLGVHLTLVTILYLIGAVAVTWLFDLSWRSGAIFSLALLTPSTGFILSTLAGMGLAAEDRKWIRLTAIASELLALLALFVILQSLSLSGFLIGTAILIGMILGLPIVFRFFARLITPYAPASEFAFLLMLALVCAYVTRELGVYYLVGAFVVGVAARRFRDELPAIASDRLLHAVELFGSFFIPFYFFSGGSEVEVSTLTWQAALIAGGLLLACSVLRIAQTVAYRRVFSTEAFGKALSLSLPLLPTLIFTLVLTSILEEKFALPAELASALKCYALASTLIPSLFFRTRPLQFEPLVPHTHSGDDDRVLSNPAADGFRRS